ncbi:MAG: TIGR03546 family protein [Elusimicrobiales bacterium]|nr:TIGR03546 family protein [Elusimicrobiales bacterium]
MNPIFIIRHFLTGILKEKNPSSIGLAFAFGFILGIIPKNNLTAHLLFISAFIFKTNIPFFFIATILFSFISFITDKITDPLGYFILNLDCLNDFFSWMYNAPIIPWTDFNNTVVCGGVIIGFIMFLPIYLCFKKLSERYLINLGIKLSKSKVVKILRLSWFFEWYFRD